MATLNSLTSKKLVFKISYINAECEEISHKCDGIDTKIWSFIKEKYPQEYKNIQSQPVFKKDDLVENDSQLKCQNDDVKKLYRKIVEVAHPDKATNKEAEFRSATEAYKKQNLGKLMEIAISLNIEIEELSEQSLELLKQNVSKAEEKLKQLKESTAWYWYNAENDERKHQLALFILKEKGVNIDHLSA
tara:strand:- start:1963 stop:2529 length:567 start_codon:yes stop_codon:yes gene_type:complete